MEYFIGEPTNTPWGPTQSCHQIAAGVFQVSTAGHGGMMVHRAVESRLSSEAQAVGDRYGTFLCFEEDCDASIVLRELLDDPKWLLPDFYKCSRDELAESVDKSLGHWNEKYKLAREERMKSMEPVKTAEGLPVLCYCILPSTQDLIIVSRGENGYTKVDYSTDDAEMNRSVATRKNMAMGVTPAQEEAMLAGSMFGWDVPGADPRLYVEAEKSATPKRKEGMER